MSTTAMFVGWATLVLTPFFLCAVGNLVEPRLRQWWDDLAEYPTLPARRAARRIRRIEYETKRAIERIQRAAQR